MLFVFEYPGKMKSPKEWYGATYLVYFGITSGIKIKNEDIRLLALS
jgi:hypothetical protein